MKRTAYKATAVALSAFLLATGVAPAQVAAAETTEESVMLADSISAGTSGTSLEKGKTYIVPVSLKNAGNLDADSNAKDCLGRYAEITVAEDGTATFTTAMRSVTMGVATDYATDVKIYKGASNAGDTEDVTVLKKKTVNVTMDGTTKKEKEVPIKITFTIPDISTDGVYVNMFVEAMNTNPDAFISIDYANAKESGDASLNYTTEKTGTAHISQFGEYDVDAKVTLTDGVISDIDITGRNFGGTYADYNRDNKLKAAIKNMKEKLIGRYYKDDTAISALDTTSCATKKADAEDTEDKLDGVSGATITSNAIREAVVDALDIQIEQEVIPDAPTAIPAAGTYSIMMKDKTSVVDHSLVENEKTTGYLTVDKNGRMTLSYRMISGTSKEPLYVLGLNGYYAGNDTSSENNLSMSGVLYQTETNTDAAIVAEAGTDTLITDVQLPITQLAQQYYTNVYLYVPAMKALNGVVSGVDFDHGRFNILSTITLYWDTLTLCDAAPDKSALQSICDMAGALKASAYTAESYAAMNEAFTAAKTVLFSTSATEDEIKTAADNLTTAVNALVSTSNIAGLEDGIYAVTGKMVKIDLSTASMSDNAIDHTIMLTVKDGKATVTMNFHGMSIGSLFGYLGSLSYYKEGYTKDAYGNPSGELGAATVNSVQKYKDGVTVSDTLAASYPDIVSFPLIAEAESDGVVPLQVMIPIMESISAGNGTQDVYLTLDYSTLEKTTAQDARFSDEDVVLDNPNPSNTNTPSNPDTSSSDNSNGNTDGNTNGETEAALTVGMTAKVGDNTYRVTKAGTKPQVTLTKSAAKSAKAGIPSKVTINGTSCEVKAIGANAFKKNKKIKTVTIPSTVTSIGASAFESCTKLTTVTIGKNVTTIGKNAFKNDKALKKVTIKATKVKTVGKGAFKNINKKATIKLSGLKASQKKALKKKLKSSGIAKTVSMK